MTQAGLSPDALSWWLSGRTIPSVDSVKALADVLEAPELVTLIPHRFPIVSMQCESCAGTIDYRASVIRCRIKQGNFAGIEVDYATGTGTYPKCTSCSRTASGKAMIRRQKRRRGKAGQIEKAKRNLKQSPEQNTAVREKAWAAKRGTHLTDEQKLRISTAKLSTKSPGRFGICRICGLITFTLLSTDINATHGSCLHQFRREHQTTVISAERPSPLSSKTNLWDGPPQP